MRLAWASRPSTLVMSPASYDLFQALRSVAAFYGPGKVRYLLEVEAEQPRPHKVDRHGVAPHQYQSQPAVCRLDFVADTHVNGVHDNEIRIAHRQQVNDLVVEHVVVPDGALVIGANADVELHRAGHVADAVAFQFGQVDHGGGPRHLARHAQALVDDAAQKDFIAPLLIDAEDADRRTGLLSDLAHQVIVAGVLEAAPGRHPDAGILAHVDPRHLRRAGQRHQRRADQSRVRVHGRAVPPSLARCE